MCCTAAYLYANFSVVLVQTNLLSANLHQKTCTKAAHTGVWYATLEFWIEENFAAAAYSITSATEPEGGSFRQIERNSGPPPSSHVVWAPRNIGLRAPS